MTSPLIESPALFPEIFRDEIFRLETRRLWLRWPVEADARALETVVVREALAREGARWPEVVDAFDAARWIDEAQAGNAAGARFDLVLAAKSRPQELLGLIGVRPVQRAGVLSLGFVLDVEHQGQGLMTEAARALVGAVFRYTSCEGIRGSSGVRNLGSRRVLEKAGFRCVKRRGSAAHGDDCQSMELRRDEWAGKPRPALPIRGDAVPRELPCGCDA